MTERRNEVTHASEADETLWHCVNFRGGDVSVPTCFYSNSSDRTNLFFSEQS